MYMHKVEQSSDSLSHDTLAVSDIPRDAQGDIHLSSACKVEGVERHLCGGLPDALGCQQPHSFAWVAEGTLPLQLQQGPETRDGHHRG